MRAEMGCCKVDAVVTVDSKGQIVLPKDVREKAKMKPGDKLALVACECDGETCCIVMLRAEKLGDSVSKMLGPMLKGILKQGDGPNERGEN